MAHAGNGGHNLGDVLFLSCISNNMLWYFLGFNYSKMANSCFLIDSSTFWMISGISKMVAKT